MKGLSIVILTVGLGLAAGGCSADIDPSATAADDFVDETVDVTRTEEALTAEDAKAGCTTCSWAPNRSMRTIKRGMTRKQVREVLGTPTRISELDTHVVRYRVYHYGQTEFLFVIGATPMTVFHMRTSAARIESGAGIHVGSSEAEVKAAYARASCAQQGPGKRLCSIPDPDGNGLVTEIELADDGVERIMIRQLL
jgi:hypothetical protein